MQHPLSNVQLVECASSKPKSRNLLTKMAKIRSQKPLKLIGLCVLGFVKNIRDCTQSRQKLTEMAKVWLENGQSKQSRVKKVPREIEKFVSHPKTEEYVKYTLLKGN